MISTHYYPLCTDLLQTLAIKLSDDNTANLSHPNLSRTSIFLSNPGAILDCRNNISTVFARLDCTALLGPEITTLPLWASQFPCEPAARLIEPRHNELMLVEALLEHKQLYENANPWALADSLLKLFDELTQHSISIDEHSDAFNHTLIKAYGLDKTINRHFGAEAALVHQLWHAMQQQLHALNYLDTSSAYRQQLNSALNSFHPTTIFYFVGYSALTPIEVNFIHALSKNNPVHFILHNDTSSFYQSPGPINKKLLNILIDKHSKNIHKTTHISQFFDAIYNSHGQSLDARRESCLARFPSSLIHNKINIFRARDRENEALAIQIQIRLWLLAGKKKIGFICNNRKLGRRVRALLERHQIELQDDSGWNLSTTSSAAILERWLQCVESDFHYLAMLDLLKSPFIFPYEDREERLITVYRLENNIVYHENIHNNIDRYLDAIKNRLRRLPEGHATYLSEISPLLRRVQKNAAPLLHLLNDTHPLADMLNLLRQSLNDIGIQEAFQDDAAGEQIIDELNLLQRAADHSEIDLSWPEFRAWLGHKLEQRQFKLTIENARVHFVNLQQSNLRSFDAVIIAASEHEFLPSAIAPSPFFNNAVRIELGLADAHAKQNTEFSLFRHRLELAAAQTDSPHTQNPLLITHTTTVKDEEIRPAAWLELLQTNHKYFYGISLVSTVLQAYIDQQRHVADADLAAIDLQRSHTTIPANLMPAQYSASSYQQLMHCPYQFYVARCLRLEPPEQIKEYLQKSDYGELVHLILQAFHSDVANLAGPFTEKITAQNRHQAKQILREISEQVFKQNIENNFAHRAWQNQWMALLTPYIDWWTERQENWQLSETEVKLNKLPFHDKIFLNARLDRVDRNTLGLSIIDYKTGTIANRDSVVNGESIQLPFYALSNNCRITTKHVKHEVIEIAYLSLGNNGIRLKNTITGDELLELQQQTGKRLVSINDQLHNGSEVIAWADEKICEWCSMHGVCRRQFKIG